MDSWVSSFFQPSVDQLVARASIGRKRKNKEDEVSKSIPKICMKSCLVSDGRFFSFSSISLTATHGPNTFTNQSKIDNFHILNLNRRLVKVDGEGVWRCGREEPRYEGFVRPFQPTFIRLTKSFPTEGWISRARHGLVHESVSSSSPFLLNRRLNLIKGKVTNRKVGEEETGTRP